MGILKVVKDAGCDIEVNSGGELWKALEAGFTGNQIIFNGTSKEVWEIEMAINADIYAIQVDSLYELSLIDETAKRLGKRANVSLRLVPEIESDTHSGLQTALLTSKFGMMPDEAFSAFRDYKDSPHLDLCGIHLHVGSQNPDPIVYAQALELLFAAVKRIYGQTGKPLGHINIGGGFPVKYIGGDMSGSEAVDAAPINNRENTPLTGRVSASQIELLSADFEPADAIHAAWQAVREDAASDGSIDRIKDLTLLLEPGRSIIADAGICLTTVRNHKSRPIRNSGSPPYEEGVANSASFAEFDGVVLSAASQSPNADHWLLTDAGFNILLSMETYKWYYHLISADRAAEPHDFPYKLAGPLCDGGDVYFDHEGQNRLPEYRLLPRDTKPGDILALLNCGAYSLAQASQYNGRFLPPVVLIRASGEAELIRKRDDFKDLVNNDIY